MIHHDLTLERLPAVLAARGTGRSHHYQSIAAGTWTPPVRIGRASAWPRHEVQALLRAQIAGASDEQMRSLVSKLIDERHQLMPPLMEVS